MGVQKQLIELIELIEPLETVSGAVFLIVIVITAQINQHKKRGRAEKHDPKYWEVIAD